DAYHHTVCSLPARSVGSCPHEFEFSKSIRSCESHICAFHFLYLDVRVILWRRKNKKARRRYLLAAGSALGENRFAYRLPPTASARHRVPTQPIPAFPRL